MRCRAIRACRLQFQWLLPSPTWILATQPVLSLNAPSGGSWGDCSMWPTRYVVKDLEVPPLVDLRKNRSDQRSQMSYILKARHLSRHTVITADILLPGEQRNEDWVSFEARVFFHFTPNVKNELYRSCPWADWKYVCIRQKNLAKDETRNLYQAETAYRKVDRSQEKRKRCFGWLLMVIIEKVWSYRKERKCEETKRRKIAPSRLMGHAVIAV